MRRIFILAGILLIISAVIIVYINFENQRKKEEEALAFLKKEARHGAIVEIKDFSFSPRDLRIKKDSIVVWINRDPVNHSATDDNGNFDTGLFARGETKKVEFRKDGLYLYHSAPYSYIKGRIVVE